MNSGFTGELAEPGRWTLGRSIADDGRCNVEELVVDAGLEGAGDGVGGMPATGAAVSLLVIGSLRSCRIVSIFW